MRFIHAVLIAVVFLAVGVLIANGGFSISNPISGGGLPKLEKQQPKKQAATPKNKKKHKRHHQQHPKQAANKS